MCARVQVASLSGVQSLLRLEALNIASTHVVTDSLLCLRAHPALLALNISNTPNVEGDLALHYIQGRHQGAPIHACTVAYLASVFIPSRGFAEPRLLC